MARFTLAAIGLLAAFTSLPGLSAEVASPATDGYMAATAKMDADMPKKMTGDADADFAMMMVPHHQSAIDMAMVELKYGKDKKLRHMATSIIAAQKKEIAAFEAWMAAHHH